MLSERRRRRIEQRENEAEIHVPEPDTADLTFSPDELTELLKNASSLDTSRVAGKHPASLADAMQTARELGIPEEHLLIAAEDMKRQKVRKAKRSIALFRRRRETMRYLTTMIAVSGGVGLMSGSLHTAFVLFACMSIPLIGMIIRWLTAVFDTDKEPAAATGMCRVCGAIAWNENATYCSKHKL